MTDEDKLLMALLIENRQLRRGAPNEHPRGSFAWAREQCRRGWPVRVKTGQDTFVYPTIGLNDMFTIAEIDSMDWEIVNDPA